MSSIIFRPILTTDFFTLEESSSHSAEVITPYYRITGPDSIICCILDQEDRFVLVQQYRPSLEQQTLEIPAGGIEEGESPLEAVRREIGEETGLKCNLLPLGKTFRLMMNRTNIREHLFMGMSPEPLPNHVPESGVEVRRIPRQELLQLALDGSYLQLAGLGILQLAGGLLQVDMWHSPLRQIEEAFRSAQAVYRTKLP